METAELPGDFERQLLREEPAAIEAWLGRVRSLEARPPDGIDWLGIAEVAQQRAHDALRHREPERATALAWARVALGAYDLRAQAPPLRERGADEAAAMRLRAALIARLGPAPGDPVLDLDGVRRWFLDGVPLTLEEARLRAERLGALPRSEQQALPFEEWGPLLDLKGRLGVVETLNKGRRLARDDDLQAWLALRGLIRRAVPP